MHSEHRFADIFTAVHLFPYKMILLDPLSLLDQES